MASLIVHLVFLLVVCYHLASASMDCEQYFTYDGELPQTFNWVTELTVGYARDQRKCNSSAVFAAVGAIESAFMKFHERLDFVDFSEQSVLDALQERNVCQEDTLPSTVWKHVKSNGIPLEYLYQYSESVSLVFKGFLLNSHTLFNWFFSKTNRNNITLMHM